MNRSPACEAAINATHLWTRHLRTALEVGGVPRSGYCPQAVTVPLVANWNDSKFGPFYGEAFADDVPKWGETYLRGVPSVEASYQLFLTNIDVPVSPETAERQRDVAWSLVEAPRTGDVSAFGGGAKAPSPAGVVAARVQGRRVLEGVRAEIEERLSRQSKGRLAQPEEDRWALYVQALNAFLDPHHFSQIRTPSGGHETIGDYRIDRCKARWRDPAQGLRAASAPIAAVAGPVMVGEWSAADLSLGTASSRELVRLRPHEGKPGAQRGFRELAGTTGNFATKVDALEVRWSCIRRLGWFLPAVVPPFENGPWLPDGPLGSGQVSLWGPKGILRLLPLFLGTCRRPRVLITPERKADFTPLADTMARHGVSVGPFSYSAQAVAPDSQGHRIALAESEKQFVVTVVSSEMPFTGD
ncbi:MAG: hypothetical protein AAF481_13110 [Acidobacteriota bacterium]